MIYKYGALVLYLAIIASIVIGCSNKETVYGTFDVKCYSNGTKIFDEQVVTSYMYHHRGDVWWRNDGLGRENGITEIHADCVVRRIK